MQVNHTVTNLLARIEELEKRLEQYENPASDRPDYYKHSCGIEAIDVAEQLTFNGGSLFTYIFRWGRKAATDSDLKKALWYANRNLERNLTAHLPGKINLLDALATLAQSETNPIKRELFTRFMWTQMHGTGELRSLRDRLNDIVTGEK